MSEEHIPSSVSSEILAALGSATIRCNEDGGIAAASQEAATLLGYGSIDELLSAAADPGSAWEDPEEMAAWLNAERESVSPTILARARDAGGKTHSLRLFRGTGPELLVVDGAREAMHENRRMQIARCESMSATSGSTGHKINNLLGGLVGYVSLLASTLDTSADPQLQKYFKALEETAARFQELTMKLMVIDKKISRSTPRPSEIVALYEQVTDTARTSIEECTVVSEAPSGNLVLFAHAELLKDALEQLIVEMPKLLNASELRTELEVRSVEGTDARFLELEDGTYSVITARMIHPPLPQIARERMFEPYYAPRGRGKGAQLELARAWGAIGVHRGTVYLTSQTERDTSVQVYLPGKPA